MIDSIYSIIDYAATLKTEDIPQNIISYSQDLFQDAISCIISGSSASGIKELRDTYRLWKGGKQATIISFKEKSSAPFAAFLNAVMCHANDYDDTHDLAVNHGCVAIVPSLLAVCEILRDTTSTEIFGSVPNRMISGREFLAALAVGLDISNRLGMAFIPFLHVGWLPTTLWGPFGSASACGRLLNLDRGQMQNAFGLAYSQIHGNRQGLLDGVLSKRIQPAFSAVAGLQAAFFAAMGITGARNIIDGDFGIKALYTNGQVKSQILSKELGINFETSNISIKPYPCCRCSHPVIDAALSLKNQHDINWQEIQDGKIFLTPQSIGQIGNPFKIRGNPTIDAQFSAQYTAALAFNRGWPRVSDFEKDNVLSRNDIQSLASRFSILQFEERLSGIIPVEMQITLCGGKQYDIRIDKIKGSHENPLSSDELSQKFNHCLDNSIRKFTQQEREKIIFTIDSFMESEDVTELIRLL